MSFYEEGGVCPVKGCGGELIFFPVENCRCHISPPCSSCVDNPLMCNYCYWQEGDPTDGSTLPQPKLYARLPTLLICGG